MKLIGSIQIQPEENFRKTHDNSSVKNKKDQKDESRKKTNKNSVEESEDFFPLLWEQWKTPSVWWKVSVNLCK